VAVAGAHLGAASRLVFIQFKSLFDPPQMPQHVLTASDKNYLVRLHRTLNTELAQGLHPGGVRYAN